MPPSCVSYSSRGLRLNYADWGNAEASPLILVHGSRDGSRSWDFVATRLRDDWHVIAPDLRGHGDSQWVEDGGYSIDDYIFDIAELIDQHCDEPVSIVAHSLGGVVALRYAGLYPGRVRRIVAIEGLVRQRPSDGLRDERPYELRMKDWIEEHHAAARRKSRTFGSIREVKLKLAERNPQFSVDLLEHLAEHAVKRNEDGSYTWKFDSRVAVRPPLDASDDDVHRLWSMIACPTLLIHGEKSWNTNPLTDGRAGHFRDVRVVLFPGAGHWVHHDALSEVVETLRSFLKEGETLPEVDSRDEAEVLTNGSINVGDVVATASVAQNQK